jgi:hypothetical protein
MTDCDSHCDTPRHERTPCAVESSAFCAEMCANKTLIIIAAPAGLPRSARLRVA